MAGHYTDQNGHPVWVATTFAARKAARKAVNLTFQFEVLWRPVCGCDTLLAAFKSRPDALKFAFAQISSFLGDTAAYRAMDAKLPRNGRMLPMMASNVIVERVSSAGQRSHIGR